MNKCKKTLVSVLSLLLVFALCTSPVLATGDMGQKGHFPTVSMVLGNSAAITTDGDLYVWGWNDSGQLGLGDFTNRQTPTVVDGISGVASVCLGFAHSAAITADGDLYTWGDNNVGQLGHGDTVERLTPEKVSGISNVISEFDELVISMVPDSSIQPVNIHPSGCVPAYTVVCCPGLR